VGTLDESDLLSTATRHQLYDQRQQHLRAAMRQHDCEVMLICDSINILYATGAQNMTVFTTRTPARYLLLVADGPCVLFDFLGGEHLAADLPTVDEVRIAQGLCHVSSNGFVTEASATMAREIAGLLRDLGSNGDTLAIDRLPFQAVDALRAAGFAIHDADPVLAAARRHKLPLELDYMRAAMHRVEEATVVFEAALVSGVSEMEAWSHFHQPFMAHHGQYVVSRLMQSGPRTFPYFQECADRVLQAGDLVCIDTDAIALEGYAVDFSRSYLVGDGAPTPMQRKIYGRALEQLQHNCSLIHPGAAFADVARQAWPVPAEHRASRYYALGHGLGLSGEYPNLPFVTDGREYPLDDVFEPGMVFCVESYVGSEAAGEGVKLEEQLLITETGVEVMSHLPFCERLGG
jgi:Xaa-Pro dipeptidase